MKLTALALTALLGLGLMVGCSQAPSAQPAAPEAPAPAPVDPAPVDPMPVDPAPMALDLSLPGWGRAASSDTTRSVTFTAFRAGASDANVAITFEIDEDGMGVTAIAGDGDYACGAPTADVMVDGNTFSFEVTVPEADATCLVEGTGEGDTVTVSLTVSGLDSLMTEAVAEPEAQTFSLTGSVTHEDISMAGDPVVSYLAAGVINYIGPTVSN